MRWTPLYLFLDCEFYKKTFHFHTQNGITYIRHTYCNKMPIAIVSVDSLNNNLSDFRNMIRGFDVLFVSADLRAIALADQLSEYVMFGTRYVTDRLSPPADTEDFMAVARRVQAVMTLINAQDITSAMVISHHSVINAWCPNFIQDEWETITM